MPRYVEIELGGKMRKLRYDFNAIADLEEKAARNINEVMNNKNRFGFSTIRLLMWAGLKHENQGLTLPAVGSMMQKYIEDGGDLTALMNFIKVALQMSGVIRKPGEEAGNEIAEEVN